MNKLSEYLAIEYSVTNSVNIKVFWDTFYQNQVSWETCTSFRKFLVKFVPLWLAIGHFWSKFASRVGNKTYLGQNSAPRVVKKMPNNVFWHREQEFSALIMINTFFCTKLVEFFKQYFYIHLVPTTTELRMFLDNARLYWILDIPFYFKLGTGYQAM